MNDDAMAVALARARSVLLFATLVVCLSTPGIAESFYLATDVPTDDPSSQGSVLLPSEIVLWAGGTYTVVEALPSETAISSLHLGSDGAWLFSLESAAELPADSGVVYEPRDVVRFDGSDYSIAFDGADQGLPPGVGIDALYLEDGNPQIFVLSFDAPTQIYDLSVEPADLVRFEAGAFTLQFDASSTTPPIPATTNLTGADARQGLTVMSFDVPTTLGGTTYLPGELVSYDPLGSTFARFFADPAWPITSRSEALAFLAAPGDVGDTLRIRKSEAAEGELDVTWGPACSAGASDFGIYEGLAGDWASHTALTCGDAGADLRETITPSLGNRYYLVVPYNDNDEGSYGHSSWGEERAKGTSSCRATQDLEPCP